MLASSRFTSRYETLTGMNISIYCPGPEISIQLILYFVESNPIVIYAYSPYPRHECLHPLSSSLSL
jgi:hypothetical protein